MHEPYCVKTPRHGQFGSQAGGVGGPLANRARGSVTILDYCQA
jgi:hypothetical protein